MTEIVVEILCNGRIRKVEDVLIEAHSSVSLIRLESLNIIVDTSTREYRGKILAALDHLGIGCDEVDIVVNTHLHHDHIANNDLFPNATLIAHVSEGPSKKYRTVGGDHELGRGVRLIHTPGHTPGSSSVFVESPVRYVIAGDALPTHENYLKWVPPRLNYDPDLALASMNEIVAFADIVVPGHGAPFKIDR